jgi:N-acylneuraminate cytidylyltransferase
VDRVIVSTDDDEIARLAHELGAEVPFRRPAALAEDATPDLPVFEHALEWLEGHDRWVPDLVVQLRPTSPFRPPGCVDAAIEQLRADPTVDSVRTVAPASQSPYKMWRLQSDGAMRPLLEDAGPEGYNQPRQALPATYWQTGHLDVVRTSTIRSQRSMSGARIGGFLIDSAYLCDIDTNVDWQHAEWLVSRMDHPIVRPRRADPRGGGLPDEVRLVVFDFDGVMTDNRVWVIGSGVEAVACSRADGAGLELLRERGIDLLVLSTETDPVVGARCRKLRVPYEQGVRDKGARLRALIEQKRIDARHVVYVGNDGNDLSCMQLVGCAVAVADAHPDVREIANLVLERPGGFGAVRELCERVCAWMARTDRERAPVASRSACSLRTAMR